MVVLGPDQPAMVDAAGDADTATLFTDMNITPFVDVVLVLLIIFMVSSNAMVDAARDGALEVSLPQAGQTLPAAHKAQALVVGMAADGRLFVGGQVLSRTEVAAALRRTYAQDPTTTIIVDADGSLPHQDVVHLMDEVRAAGFMRLGIGARAEP